MSLIYRTLNGALRIQGLRHSSGATKTTTPDDLYKLLVLKCTAHDSAVLDSYEKFVTLAAKHLDIDHVETTSPFRVIKRRTMLASRFVRKKYRVQYETRSYFRDISFKNLTGSTLSTFLEYVERNLPEGVHLNAEKHLLGELPFELKDSSQQKLESN